MKNPIPSSKDPLEPLHVLRAFESFKPFHSIIHYYVDLSCFLIPSADVVMNNQKSFASSVIYSAIFEE